MNIKGNTVVTDENQLVGTFDTETFKTVYEEGVTQSQKMACGRILKPYKLGTKVLDEVEVTEEAVEEEATVEYKAGVAPWDVFSDCPNGGPAGDKTPEVVRWLHKFQPKFYEAYYQHRMTVIDVETQETKDVWMNRGGTFFARGLKVTDCPVGANAQEKEYFKEGFMKYMNDEISTQS